MLNKKEQEGKVRARLATKDESVVCSSIVLQQSLVFVSGNLPVKPYSYSVLPQFTDDSLI